MPVKPTVKTMEANSVDILNAIRNDASPEYKAAVPYASNNTESIREIGNILMTYQPLQNEFLKALVNRIGRVIITSKMYENPWAFFKKGLLEYGETVEEIFVNIAKPHDFDPAVAETQIFRREIPDVRAAFHTMNYQKFYKTTVSNDQLRQAFLSWTGITDLISKIINAMYTSAAYDEFLSMKYLLARLLLQGNISMKTIPAANATNAKNIVTTLKGISNTLEFMSPDYNMAGVQTFTKKDDQFLIINALFDAVIDVEVLASAFNMDKAEFMGHRVLVDSFSNLDTARLQELYGNEPWFESFTDDQLALLDSVPAVLVDRNFFMIFDNYYNFTEQYNGEGLYWNYWYHTWKTFSASPFANALGFSSTAATVTSVVVTPATATVATGQSLKLSAAVSGTGFYNRDVTWSITGNASANTSISPDGVLAIGSDETAASITVTATSVGDATKSGTSTITVS